MASPATPALPEGATCIIHKPMGSDLAETDAIIRLIRARKLCATVNSQLRFAPALLALKDAIAQGLLGDVVDIDGLLAVDTPWHLWAFLATCRGWKYCSTPSTPST